MACETPCNGCTQQCDDKPLADIEDYTAELEKLRLRSKELEALISSKTPAQRRGKKPFRSSQWFNRTDDRGISLAYMDRQLNYGLTTEELKSGKPIIGIAQSGSDLSPCNRHHLQLAKRVRDGIISAGGIPLEFPTHPIQETLRRPTATLDRNLLYLGLVEILHGYPLDGVVLTTGCDKTTPAMLMAAATVNLPAICLNVGPM
ncbi:hypothetical protein VDGD_21281 [Verticillium dahliae]|nr:hypothetical protein VDGD_21281 [Verticillium dahliae]